MGFFMNILKAIGAVVDTVVPVGHGNRTKIAVIACPVLAFLTPALAASPKTAPFVPVLNDLAVALCGAAPAFALAGLVRDKK